MIMMQCTDNYELFEPHPHNRDIKKTEMLEKSMEKYGFDEGFPIRCIKNGDGKLKITHGHHRFFVARKKKIPLWFVVARKEIPLFESETSNHQWDIMDYVVARARAGDQDAAVVLEYHRRTGIGMSSCISMFGGERPGSSNKSRALKQGKFKIADHSKASLMEDIVEQCESLGVSFAKNSLFVKAIGKCLLVGAFDIDLFMRNVSAQAKNMYQRRHLDGYLDLIEDVYNHRQRNKVPLAFMAREASASRSSCKTKKKTA